MAQNKSPETLPAQDFFLDTHAFLMDAPIGIFMSTPEGRYLGVNTALARIYGYSTPEEMIAAVTDIAAQVYVDPGDRELFKRLLEDQGEVVNHESRFRRKDGTILWVSRNARVLKGKDGVIVAYQGFTTDITDRRQAEGEKVEAEKRFRLMFTNAPMPYQSLDEQGNFLDVNQTFLDALGYSRDELIGRNFGDILPPAWREHFKENFPDFKAVGEILGVEFEMVKKDGSTILVYFNGKIQCDDQGRFLRTHCIFQDITNQKRTEEYLQKVLDATNDGIWDYDLATGRFACSERFAEILGYKSEEIQDFGCFCEDNIHPEDADGFRKVFKGYINGSLPRYATEFRLKTKEGDYKWIYTRGQVLRRDATSKPMRIVGAHTDITERKQAEEENAKSASLLSATLESTADGLLVINSDGIRTLYNQRFIEMWHIPKSLLEDSVNETMLQYVLDQMANPEDFLAKVRELYDTPAASSVDLLHFADGRVFERYSQPQRLDGKIIGRVWSFRDITERVTAEETLIRQQRSIELSNRIANVFLTSAEDEVFADVLDIILLVLDSRFGYFGYIDEAGDLVCPSLTRDVWEQCQVAGKNVFFPRAGWGGLWGRSLMEKQTLVANGNLQFPVGHVTLENALAVPIVHHDNLIGQFVVANKAGGYDKNDRNLLETAASQTAPILFAIQERARQETAHVKLQAQLTQAQKMESVGRLAGGVAHDFNNMLSVINGYAELVLNDLQPNSSSHAKIQSILKAGRQSADIVRQLLAYARKQTIDPQILHLNEALDDMLRMLGNLIGENIELACMPGHNLWKVKMDPAQLNQMLANLAINARDAITDVGRVTIETGNVVFDQTFCAMHAGTMPGEFVLLSVSDNGRGMDQETQERLFEPFFTTKEPGKGTGLGLATVYGIVKQNNGFIYVYSEPGKGTTFRVYLPRYQSAPEEERPRPTPDEIPRGRETVLLVEDKPVVLDLCTAMLENLGYEVLPAADQKEALRLAREHPGEIHLLLTDVIMPGMNGRDLKDQILPLRPEIKCLFMSGYTANVIVHHGVLEEGINFIEKPFTRHSLAVKLRQVLTGA
jgi:PAS domain S-box-containing protein